MTRYPLPLIVLCLSGCQSLGVIDLASRAIDKCQSVASVHTRGGRWYESPDFSTTCHRAEPKEYRHVPNP